MLVGGADLSGYPVRAEGFTTYHGIITYTPHIGDTLVGGGDGDLLVSAGTDNGQSNVVIAGAGAETLTGSGSAAKAFFFGGTGADVIALGGGYSVVGAGGEATFIQAGSGSSTVFAGGNGAAGDVFAFVDGGAGGSELIASFRVGVDLLALCGYVGSGAMAGITNSQVTGGSTVLTLADDTRITLQGVTNLGTSSFV